jgi:MFS family permease
VSNTEKAPQPPGSKIFYGYWVLVVSFLCLALFSGSGVGVFSLFVTPLQADFGWGRAEIMLGFTLFFLLTGLAAPPVGILVDRYGVRGVIAIGAFIVGLGFASLYLLQHLWHLYLAYFFIGTGMAAMAQVPASTMVSNWFVKRRGMAIGIMSTGIGAGILVLAPLAGGFLIPTFGWRATYLALGIMSWMLIPLALFVVRTRPSDMGLFPDGAASAEALVVTDNPTFTSRGLSFKIALGTLAFWLLAVTFFVNGFSSLGVIQNQVPYLQDIGFPLVMASSALTGLGLGSAIGKFFFGWLCDKIKATYACALSFVLLAAGTIMLMFIKPGSPLALIWLFSTILGLGGGGWLPTMSMLVNINFGLVSYGAIFGMLSLAQGVGGALGPLFGGYLYDLRGTYSLAFTIFLVLFGVAMPLVLSVRRPRPYQ